jgi:hypothetical protein
MLVFSMNTQEQRADLCYIVRAAVPAGVLWMDYIMANGMSRLSLSSESAAIQQCFSLTINQRTVHSTPINQKNEQGEHTNLLLVVVDL